MANENNVIFTHKEAADIVDAFEGVLIANNISVPSPEDDERDKDDKLGLYGSVYDDLLDYVEDKLIFLLEQEKKTDAKIVKHTFDEREDETV